MRARLIGALGSLSRRLPPSRQRTRLGRAVAYLLGDPPAVTAEVGSLHLSLRPADRTAGEAFWSGHYEDRFVDLLAALLDPGMTVVDAGANVGLIGLRLADRLRTLGGGRVLLVEPVPANAARLHESIRANELEAFCTVFEVALGDGEGRATLFVEGRAGRSGNAGRFAPRGRARAGGLTETEVALRSLDDLLHDAGGPTVGLIKLDVEGGELAFVRGALRCLERDTPPLFGEFHARLMPLHGGSFADVMALVTPLGFRAYRVISASQLVVEVGPEPGPGGRLLATPTRVDSMIARLGDGWRLHRA